MKYDKIFLEFPLCAIHGVVENKDLLVSILSWCVVCKANESDEGEFEHRIINAARKMKMEVCFIEDCIERYNVLNWHISSFIQKNGKDSYCRIGKDLFFEAISGGFNIENFCVYCGIQSVIGKKKKFVRITYDRIRYAMLGYRSKEIFEKNSLKRSFLTDRQIKRIVDILNSKQLFSKFTYARRCVYYSTRLNDDELKEAVMNSKIYWMRKTSQIEDIKYTQLIKEKMKEIQLEKNVLEKSDRELSRRKLKFIRCI